MGLFQDGFARMGAILLTYGTGIGLSRRVFLCLHSGPAFGRLSRRPGSAITGAMSHDFNFQRRETFDTFRESKGVKLPARAVVDFAFFPELEKPDWTGISRALEAAGYRVSRPDAEGEEGEELIASTGPIPISAEEIWKYEEAATKIAIRFDFYPDGWELDI
ncbi:Regulator of ribonuclease activity B [Rhodobacter sp. 24-YEA-8]|nr:Regulator of ribonuclease activity B [Rhodobacter sp. 24-YEA-8]